MIGSFAWPTRLLVYLFLIVATVAILFWSWSGYLSLTQPMPKNGGHYIEGMISQPRYINPLLAQTSDADAALSKLIYASLFAPGKQGIPEKSIASDYTVADDGKLITVYLKTGVKFHDGEELTAEDVVFTIRAVQNPAYKSPIRSNWLGVEVNAPERYTVVFSLKKPYFGFLDNLTLGILPKHIWESIPADRFTLADYNLLQPIGAGPFRFQSIDKDASGNILSYHLQAFDDYFGGRPFLDRLTFRFYADEDSLISGFNHQEVMGIYSITSHQVKTLSEKRNPMVHEIALPRLFAVFLNTSKSVALAYDEVRQALTLATNRDQIIERVLDKKGLTATGPLLPFMFGFTPSSESMFDLDQANKILDDKGWQRGQDGIRSKGGVPLHFALTTLDLPELTLTADTLRDDWRAIGADIEVKVLSQNDLYQSAIRPREYEALLFGQGSVLDPDPYSFWHSSQKADPGLNLALFDNKQTDDILASARETLDQGKRADLYRQFQDIVRKEQPAIFLYSPAYLTVTSNKLQGVTARVLNTPADRFFDAPHWYLSTKRVKK